MDVNWESLIDLEQIGNFFRFLEFSLEFFVYYVYENLFFKNNLMEIWIILWLDPKYYTYKVLTRARKLDG